MESHADPLPTVGAGRRLATRAATQEDAPAIATIYNQGIEDGDATFETRLREPDEIRAWFDGRHPTVVVVDGERVVAFAGTSTYRPRACYDDVAEFSVYVERGERGRGAGRLAMEALCDASERAGFHKILSRIFVENEASRRLCRSVGFREVGVYRRHARLHGTWRDCVIVERLLGDAAAGDEADAAAGAGTAEPPGMPSRVLFLCTHNSARSQMAEGLLRAWGGNGFTAFSAGTEATAVRPEAIAVMDEVGIDIRPHESKTLQRYLREPFDRVITVCDDAREACPVFPGARRTEHWSIPDPSAVRGSDEVRLAAFRRARDELTGRVRLLIQRP